MRTWVIPYSDQELDFWEEVAGKYGEHILSVYLPLPGGSFASGRPPQPDQHMQAFLQHARLAKSVLVNPIVLNRPAEQLAPDIIQALIQLRDDFDVKSVTVVSLSLAKLIKEALPDYRVGASTLMGIQSPTQVLMAKEFLDFIVPDNRLLRDLAGLQRLRQAFAGEIRLIVNEGCLPGCLYRTQHFYEMAYSNTYPQSLCNELLDSHPWLRMTGAWVLPRQLEHFEGLYDSLKLSGRVTLRNRSLYLKVLDAYIFRKDILPCDIGGGPASLLEPITIPDELFVKLLNCNKDCLSCKICQSFYERATSRIRA